MAQPPKSVLWIDDEGDLLESHRIFLREKGFEVESATNADDAVEMLRRRAYGIVLLDEQMPGKRGLEAYREIRELDPLLPIIMVTKSEEDATLKEAIGVDVRDYLVKPINPRQVLAVITRVLDGPRIRQQAIARSFVERFRAIELDRQAPLDWRGWVSRYSELVEWDVSLADAREQSLYDSLQSLYPDMHREFAAFMRTAYPAWLQHLDGDRPPLSIDVVSEFLLPILERNRAAVFVVIDCLRLDQWAVLEPSTRSVLRDRDHAPFLDSPHCDAVLAKLALQRTLSGGDRRALSRLVGGARGRVAQRARTRTARSPPRGAQASDSGALREDLESADSAELERRVSSAIAREGVSAFVFNFVDLLTHGRSESAILYEVARDEIALRQLTKQWFERSVLFTLLKDAARKGIPVLLTSDHGSIHCLTPATVFAKRDATANLRYKFGEDLRAERPEHALSFANEDDLKLPRRGFGANTLLAVGDTFFVYPTKLREYQTRYRGSFLHGGVTPEECILPVALLTPRR